MIPILDFSIGINVFPPKKKESLNNYEPPALDQEK